MTDVNQWIAEQQQPQPQSQDATATAPPQAQHPEVPQQPQQQYYYIPQQQQMVMGRSSQWDSVQMEKVKIWIQFGGLVTAIFMIGALAGAGYTRATLHYEVYRHGLTQQQ